MVSSWARLGKIGICVLMLSAGACASSGSTGDIGPSLTPQAPPPPPPTAGGTKTKTSDWQTTEYNNQPGLESIEAAKAYATIEQQGLINGGAGIRIAIIDSGIDASHDDLQGQVIHSIQIDARSPVVDSHATHLAGIVAALLDEGEGSRNIHGVAFAADLVDIKVSYADVNGNILYETQAVAAGIASAAGMSTQFVGSRVFSADPLAEADILNISIGGGTAATTRSVLTAMRGAAAQNKIMILAAAMAGV